jgi:class 3 adenylate cyclase
MRRIAVFLADDNVIVREGVRALLAMEPDIEIVGTAADYEELISGAETIGPQVVVTDIRMPPGFRTEGIDAAKHIRKRHPGTGIVILSQYDDPEYAIALLGEGASGYAYLLKERVAEGDQLVRAVREVAIGGSMLDPTISEALLRPVREEADLNPAEQALLASMAQGRSVKGIAAAQRTTPASVADAVEKLFLKLARGASAGARSSLTHLRMLHEAIVEREERGETLSRFLPGGLAEKLRREGHHIGDTERLTLTVLMSDVRGYSAIAENTDPSLLCAQLNEHRAEMNRAILSVDGTVMTFIGDAVMGVFGAPFPRPDHARRAYRAGVAMHDAQARVNERWEAEGLPPFRLGIGISTGDVAAALLGSEERLEYTVIGDTVNLAQRLQQWAKPGEIVLSEATHQALGGGVPAERLPPAAVKGRAGRVAAYRVPAATTRRRGTSGPP